MPLVKQAIKVATPPLDGDRHHGPDGGEQGRHIIEAHRAHLPSLKVRDVLLADARPVRDITLAQIRVHAQGPERSSGSDAVHGPIMARRPYVRIALDLTVGTGCIP